MIGVLSSVNNTLNAAIFYTSGAAMLSYFLNTFLIMPMNTKIKVLVYGIF